MLRSRSLMTWQLGSTSHLSRMYQQMQKTEMMIDNLITTVWSQLMTE